MQAHRVVSCRVASRTLGGFELGILGSKLRELLLHLLGVVERALVLLRDGAERLDRLVGAA